MEETLKLILQRLDELRTDVSELKSDVVSLKQGQADIRADIKELDRKTTIIFDQTAGLTEFQTDVREELAEIKKEVSFIGHKEYQNEKEVYSIKKQLEIIK